LFHIVSAEKLYITVTVSITVYSTCRDSADDSGDVEEGQLNRFVAFDVWFSKNNETTSSNYTEYFLL